MNYFVILLLIAFVSPLSAENARLLKPLGKYHARKGVPVTPGARIVGGQNAATGQFPFVTAITIDDSFFCTSSLLSHNWIVTAGHCAADSSTFGVKLGITNFNANEDGVLTTVSRKVIVNPYYNDDNSSYDIALIMMATPITYTTKIQPVKLPTRSMVSNTFVGTAVRTIGWGLSDAYPDTVSPIMNYVDLKVISNDECSKSYPGFIDSSIICAYAAGSKGTCGGDSGGPLVMNYDTTPVLIGVTDFGPYGGCWAGDPNGFARVTHLLDWIHSNTGITIQS